MKGTSHERTPKCQMGVNQKDEVTCACEWSLLSGPVPRSQDIA